MKETGNLNLNLKTEFFTFATSQPKPGREDRNIVLHKDVHGHKANREHRLKGRTETIMRYRI